jgi:hypothetical protein
LVIIVKVEMVESACTARVAPEERAYPGLPAAYTIKPGATREVAVSRRIPPSATDGTFGQQFLQRALEKFPRDPEHPVRTALREAYFTRTARLIDLQEALIQSGAFEALAGLTDISQIPPAIREYATLADEAAEIDGWAFDPIAAEEHEGLLDREGDLLQQSGISFSQIRRYQRSTHKNPSGAPIRKRSVAVESFELRTKDAKRWSWSALAVEFCECGARKHNQHCQERIRKQVGHLKRVLKKYAIL